MAAYPISYQNYNPQHGGKTEWQPVQDLNCLLSIITVQDLNYIYLWGIILTWRSCGLALPSC